MIVTVWPVLRPNPVIYFVVVRARTDKSLRFGSGAFPPQLVLLANRVLLEFDCAEALAVTMICMLLCVPLR